MYKFKLPVFVLVAMMFFANPIQAAGVGILDFKKVGTSYEYAKRTFKDLDNRALELQQFLINKEQQYKRLDTPVAKKNFEEQTQKELTAKKDALERLQIAKEEEIYKNIITAAKAVANRRQLEMVIDSNAIYVGGVDISDEVIRYLNTQSPSVTPSNAIRR